MFDLFWWHALVLLAGGFLIFLGVAFPLTRRGQVLTRACLVLVLAAGVYGYTNFGRFHGGRVYHYTEEYLYYMGAKYYKEVSHRYLYVSFVAAFAELEGPVPQVREIRDLEHPFHTLGAAEAHYLFLREVKPRFTPARWNQFKEDVRGFLRGPWTPGDWSLGDVGYNPPPTYGVVARFIANRIRLTPQALSLIPFIDWAVVALAGLVVFRTFGFLPAAGYYLIFLTNDLAGLHWIGGGFCRMFWFAALTMAFCALERRRYMLAGLGFGFAIGMRIFPFVFFFGALVPLVWESLQSWRCKRQPAEGHQAGAPADTPSVSDSQSIAPERRFGSLRPIAGLLLGCGLMLALLGGLSLIYFSATHWRDFAAKIGVHGKTFFVMHLGYDKIATATWNKGPQYFSDLANFERWNVRLNDLFNTHWPWHWLVCLLFFGAALLASLRSPPYLASLLVGETILFFYALPANYYYIYLALFFAVLVHCVAANGARAARARFWLLLLFLVWCNLVGGFSNDWILLNGWINLALLALLILYTGSMLWENAEWRSGFALGYVACVLVPLALITFKPRSIKIDSRERDYVQLALFSPNQPITDGRASMQRMAAFGPGWLTGEQLLVEAQANTTLLGFLNNSAAGPYELELIYTAAPDYARASLDLLGKNYLLDTVAPTLQLRTVRLNLDLPSGPNYFRIYLHAWDSTRNHAGFNSYLLRHAADHLRSAKAL
jgi:hypothetical protein